MATDLVSSRLTERAKRLVPAGVHSNSRIGGGPTYFTRAEGAYLWDIEGRRYLDCTMGNGAVVLGHGHPAVDAAVVDAVGRGLTTGHETEASIEAVALLAEIVPSFGLARFANTGTEAVMHALAIARAATGKERVAKAEGAYHGWADAVFVSCWAPPDAIGPPDRPHSPPGCGGLSVHSAETVIFPFNDGDATEAILREHAGELAAVLVEPVMIDLGFVPAQQEYLERLRALTSELGILLVFDELLTGFRIAPGGARALYRIEPDLTTFGKSLANGYPLAALEGQPELMALTDPTMGGGVGYVGTYNAHQIPVAAAVATLELLRDGAVQRQLDERTRRLTDGLAELAEHHGVSVVAAGGGGHFQPYFCPGPVRNYREALATSTAHYAVFRDTLRARGILVAEKPLLHCAISAAHGDEELAAILDATDEAFTSIAGAGAPPERTP